MTNRRFIPGVPYAGETHPTPKPRKPAVIQQPQTYKDLRIGTNLIAKAVRPTLGPLPRLVVMERLQRTDAPEFLDDGATIARRIVEIEPRGSDVGAMLIRQALWRMNQQVGDGSATMTVMYQVLLNECMRYVVQFNHSPMLLRAGLEHGLKAVLLALDCDVAPLTGKDAIASMARGLCQDDVEMATMMGEIFDVVGAEGLIVVEEWNRPGLEREYIDGTYWHLSGWFSRMFVTEKADHRTTFADASLLISDLTLTEPDQLFSALDKCIQGGVKKLVIVAKEVSDRVVGLLVNNNQAKTIETIAVRTPKIAEMDRVGAMEDIAVLTGGKPFYSAGRETFENFRVDDLGQARRAWATESLFGIYGGKGDPRRVRQYLAQLRGSLRLAESDYDKKTLQQRIGRLSGGTAILRVGGTSLAELEARKVVAERAVAAVRLAVQAGVVAGGGAALLNAQTALEGLPAKNDEEAVAFRILARALEEPMRTIAKNAGCSPDVMVEKVKAFPKGYGVDARTRQIVDLRQAGIVDSLLVLKKALEIAVSGAAMALTTDVIVHHRKPEISIEP
jgi:chaperonin GroEL